MVSDQYKLSVPWQNCQAGPFCKVKLAFIICRKANQGKSLAKMKHWLIFLSFLTFLIVWIFWCAFSISCSLVSSYRCCISRTPHLYQNLHQVKMNLARILHLFLASIELTHSLWRRAYLTPLGVYAACLCCNSWLTMLVSETFEPEHVVFGSICGNWVILDTFVHQLYYQFGSGFGLEHNVSLVSKSSYFVLKTSSSLILNTGDTGQKHVQQVTWSKRWIQHFPTWNQVERSALNNIWFWVWMKHPH